ncbi:hypothetical protein ASPZODRAFT_151782 [Penicilliopsis zonata CBS 506.65]|uniref:Cytochrome P450 monooxygenase n=1 Tax=Penicilliopsis zonata CBS 506.65 TaxID=1073090 RepID=A0A1L9SJI3_9EURO|nr:hypothetical protein ASPZODRAFT_151782 [Penicilliopsis zonata CBS 506.65]OJJ47271.1 hypothetical protein ASPZODRAFT_151782 [Penicilliopsis zonata CBS 506.65]
MALLEILKTVAWSLLLAISVWLLHSVLYNIIFHPLRKFPGPRLAAISNLPFVYWSFKGVLHSRIKELHDQYGDVVRIKPNALDYRTPGALKDIYGHRKQGTGTFIKDPGFYTESTTGPHILVASEADHPRMRRLLLHGFSEKAMREQESIVQEYVDLLIKKLQGEVASSRDTVDMTRWYNYTTFDLIGDLAFGEPFDCLKENRYDEWVALTFKSALVGTYMRTIHVYPWLAFLIIKVMMKHLMNPRIKYFQKSKEKVQRRIHTQTDRPDFWSYVLRYNDERGLRENEIEGNAGMLIIAGSETTATLLSGCTFYLLKNPDVLQKLVEEIRGAFKSMDEITFLAVSHLKYTHAVLEESLRLYPPVPGILPRCVPEGGAFIDGTFIPQGTSVSVAHYSTYHSSSNFADPDSFIPERWLDNPDARFSADKRDVLQPFSYGPRNCLGKNLAYAEMRVILAKVLWNFDLSLQPECANWNQQLSFTFWSKGPLMVKLKPRY